MHRMSTAALTKFQNSNGTTRIISWFSLDFQLMHERQFKKWEPGVYRPMQWVQALPEA